MKDPDVSVSSDMDPDDLSPVPSIHALGKSRPTLHQAIRIGEFGWFGVSGLLGERRRSKHPYGDSAGYETSSRLNVTRQWPPPIESQHNMFDERMVADSPYLWSRSTLFHQRGSALADFLKRRFEATKFLRT